MDTRKLAIFNDLAETQNYSRTAERMFLTQSTVSKHIMSLEKEWNVKLFIRVHRQVKLTSAGKLLLPKVKKLLQQSNDLQQLIDDQIWLTERPLIIQGLSSLPQYQAFKMIAEFTRQYPRIKLKFSENNVDQLEHALDQKNVDIVFTRIFNNKYPDYNVLPNETDQTVALIHQDNLLSQASSLEVEQLKSQNILIFSDNFSKANPLYQKLQSLIFQPKITYRGQNMNLILEMVNQNQGISIVSKESVDLTNYPQIKVVTLKPQSESKLVFMKQKDNDSAVVSLFWKFITEQTNNYFHK